MHPEVQSAVFVHFFVGQGWATKRDVMLTELTRNASNHIFRM
jgi:hypothetical protein